MSRLEDLLEDIRFIQGRYAEAIRTAPSYERACEIIEIKRKEEQAILARNGLFELPQAPARDAG